MTVAELIDQRIVKSDSVMKTEHQREQLMGFAIELLEILKKDANEPLKTSRDYFPDYGTLIDKALEELRK